MELMTYTRQCRCKCNCTDGICIFGTRLRRRRRDNAEIPSEHLWRICILRGCKTKSKQTNEREFCPRAIENELYRKLIEFFIGIE